jgi:hypothetical protein
MISSLIKNPYNSFTSVDFYDTGWVANNDWTNQLLGTTAGGNLVHNLNTSLVDLVIHIWLSIDTTEVNTYYLGDYNYDGTAHNGWGIKGIDLNTIAIRTAATEVNYMNTSGQGVNVTNQAYYYRIKVYKLKTGTILLGTKGADILLQNYSLAEQDTGILWHDGKKIYKKTINFGALPNAAAKNVAHGITNFYRLVKAPEGYGWDGTNCIDVNMSSTITRTNVTNLQIDSGATNLSTFTESYWTLFYTKTV